MFSMHVVDLLCLATSVIAGEDSLFFELGID